MSTKDKRFDNILNSMQGSQRAKPRPELFDAIQRKIRQPKVKILPMYQLRAAAAVGLLLLTLNVYAFRSLFLNEATQDSGLVMEGNDESLISNYQIYD